MQTFLPFPSFTESAACLDNKRLGRQRVEVYQILNLLSKTGSNIIVPPINTETKPRIRKKIGPTRPNGPGWTKHPIAKMWRGYEVALAYYGVAMCTEWRSRGFKDSLLPVFETVVSKGRLRFPSWLKKDDFHLSHQSNLIRKLPEHYNKFFPGVSGGLPYIWPDSLAGSDTQTKNS